ncbi:MAG: hypothetical protein R3D85_09095 [Paracoccaceae bacterium]
MEQPIWFDTVAEGELTQLDQAPDGSDPTDPGASDPGGSDPGTVDPGPADPGTGDAIYSLIGPDAQLFTIDPLTGAISTQDWFQPSYDDAWDVDEDHIYEVTRVTGFADGSPNLGEDLFYQTQPDGSFGPMPQVDPLMALLALDATATIEDAVPEDDLEEDEPQDLVL